MSKFIKISLIGIGCLVVAVILVFTGVWIGRRSSQELVRSILPQARYPYGRNIPNRMPGGNMGDYDRNSGRGYRPGMSGMGADPVAGVPLSVDEAYQAAEIYLGELDIQGLEISEVMVFDNHAYVRVDEASSDIGAFELLVDPVSKLAYPEQGPNIMWNLKYGNLNHQAMMNRHRGMMGGAFADANPADVSAEMTVTEEQALLAAQEFLDQYQPGLTTGSDAEAFYGYYTIDILRDGMPVGMLSVNGFNSLVFLHHWHGIFIEEADY